MAHRPPSPPRRRAVFPILLAVITLLLAIRPARAQEARWASVSVGDDHVCALDEQGRAWCLGNNHAGQLGIRTSQQCGRVSESGRKDCFMTPVGPVPLRAGGDMRFASITAGRYLTCGVDAQGRAFCWGAAIGDGEAYADRCLNGEPCSLHPVPLLPERRLARVDMKARCAVDADGEALCWADGSRTAGRMTTPWPGMTAAQVDGDPEARTMCAVMRDGQAYCRGEAVFGVRGTGSADSADAEKPVAAGPLVQVAAIHTWACGLDGNGAAHCWGAAGYGDVARDSVPRAGLETCERWGVRTWCNLRPAPLEGGHRFSGIIAAVRGTLPTVYEMIGITPAGAAYAWGGDRVPRPWHPEGRWRSAAAGDWGQCAISLEGELFCWGRDPHDGVQRRIPHPERRS